VSRRDGVVVVAPEKTPEATVQRFVAAKQYWIERARRRVGAPEPEALERARALPDTINLPALGQAYSLVRHARGRQRAREHDGRVLLEGADETASARQLLGRWLRRVGRRELLPWLERLARVHDLRYERAAIRGQQTRWGSCSGRGTISLNYKLLFLTPDLVEHVLLHELAHTRHLNHSRAFWRLLARLDPDWRGHHEALRSAEAELPLWLDGL
jgi:predicted metal-dependent hydrolase